MNPADVDVMDFLLLFLLTFVAPVALAFIAAACIGMVFELSGMGLLTLSICMGVLFGIASPITFMYLLYN